MSGQILNLLKGPDGDLFLYRVTVLPWMNDPEAFEIQIVFGAVRIDLVIFGASLNFNSGLH